MTKHRSALLAAVALAPLLFGASVTTAAAQAADAPQQTNQVETVTVTARRLSESAQVTPVAVSAFSEQALKSVAAENIGALQGAVPNLNIVQGRGSSSSANIYIRGVGQPDALATFDPAVGVYLDDVYISRIRGALFDVYDIERIEVLRGPQGTLYGKNTIGGALKIVSKKPSLDKLSASFTGSYGSYNAVEASAKISGPIVADTLGGSLALYYGARDGYVEDPLNNGREYNNKDTFGARGALRWRPTTSFEAILALDYTKETPNMTVGRSEATLFSTNLAPNATNPLVGILSLAPPAGSDFNYKTSTTPRLPNTNTLDHAGGSLTLTYDFSDTLTFKSITAARALNYDDFIDIDATRFELGDVFVGVEQDQQSQEFQLLYNGNGPVSGVIGAYYLKENIKSAQIAFANDLLRFGASPFNFRRDIGDDLKLESKAVYGQATAKLTEKLSASLGLRVTEETKRYDRFTFTTSGLPGLTQTVSTPFSFKTNNTFDDFSPSFSVDYKFADNVFGYFKIAKGFKSGGVNGRANNPGEQVPYEPETVVSYEAGLKTNFFDRRLQTNFNVFNNDYKNFQARVSQGDPTQPALAALTVLNAGKLLTTGAELEVKAVPVENLVLSLDVGYLDARYKQFRDAIRIAGVLTPIDRSWQIPAFSPEWTARFGAAYEFQLGANGSLTVGADANYRSEAALAVDNANLTTRVRFPGMFQDAFTIVNARAVWASADDRYTLGLFGKNITDEVYKTDAQEFSSIGGIQTAYYGAPQTVQLVFGVKY